MNVRIHTCVWYMLVSSPLHLLQHDCNVMFWLAEFLTQKFSATWAVSVYFAYQRTWKPFNPILGETYEMVNHQGITFLAEQVSGMKLSLPKGLVQIFFFEWKTAREAPAVVFYI
jgi:hypothetical protein